MLIPMLDRDKLVVLLACIKDSVLLDATNVEKYGKKFTAIRSVLQDELEAELMPESEPEWSNPGYVEEESNE